MDYLYPCMLFLWLSYLWETYLHWRQRKVYKTCVSIPEELRSVLDEKNFNKSRVYQLDKSSYSLVHNLIKQLEFLVIIVAGGIPFAWDVAGRLLDYCYLSRKYEVLQSVTFLLLMLLYSAITDTPWTIYETFVLEEKHGFNKQTWGFFVKDQVKKFVMGCVLNCLISAGLVAIIKWGGQYFYIYAWLFVLVVSLVLIFIYHDFIAPCFDKFRPLPEGDLRTAIEGLASSLHFPLKKLLVVEGSKRSAHSNAYFYGFWKNKYIVLFDTLLQEGIMAPDVTPVVEEGEGCVAADADANVGTGEKEVSEEKEENEDKKKKKGCSTAQILGVLAHELGHWKLSHNLKMLFISELNLLLLLFLFGYFMNQQDMYTSFGFPNSKPVFIGLILFLQLVFSPYNEVMSFLMTQLVRRFEYQADGFAVSLGHSGPLSSALVSLYEDNLGFPVADPLYSAFHHSHPTLLERLRALKTKTD